NRGYAGANRCARCSDRSCRVRCARSREENAMHAHTRNAMFALVLLVTASGVAFAGAPMAKGQAPGWYRMKVGDFEVTALSDGTADLPMDQLLTNTTPD